MTDKVELALDHLTDIVALVVIGGIVLYSGIEPTQPTLAAIVMIALGKKYKDLKLQG